VFASGGGGGGGGATADQYWYSTTNNSIYTTGSVIVRGGDTTYDSPLDKGSDLFFYVSGSAGTRGTTTAGTALFGGDLVVSGSLSAQGDIVEITGSLIVTNGISGSLTKLTDGTSYLVAGSNVSIASSSNGSIVISSTASASVAGNNSNVQFNATGSFSASPNFNFYSPGTLALTGSLEMKGDILPDANTTHSLGSSNKRWANVYTGDLHLRNDRGDWTIVEERDYLCVVNNTTGRRYKMMLQPLDDY